MRVVACAGLVLILLMAGCSGSPAKKSAAGPDQTNFDDLNVQASATTGVLLGVVVDEAIRPLKAAAIDIIGPDGAARNETTDKEGRFVFSELPPGAYIIKATLLNYQPAQTSAHVDAGVDSPPVVRVQLNRLFSQAPYTEQVVFDGLLQCSISFPIGTTCVNDYTRLVGERCTPVGGVCTTQCKGGCFRDYNLSRQAGNIREYVSAVGAGWQSIIWETSWKRTSDYSSAELTLSVSFFTRPDASHFYANKVSANPLRLQLDVGVEGPGQQEEPTMILPEGQNDIFSFFNSGGIPPGGGVAINQAFKSFETHFYYGVPPEGWSFVNGDPMPF